MNQFVPYNIALLAKEKGFDEECIAAWVRRKEEYILRTHGNPFGYDIGRIFNSKLKAVAAPLYQQLVDWFREKFIHITVNPYCNTNEVISFTGRINFMINEFRKPDIAIFGDLDYYEVFNKTLEEAFKCI